MRGSGLRTHILFYVMIPVLCVGGVLSAYFSLRTYNELNDNVVAKCRMIAHPLSTSASFAMTQRSLPLLQGLVNEAFRNTARDVVAIAIFDKNNRMLVTSSITPENKLFPLQPDQKEYLASDDSVKLTNDGIIMRMPIYAYDEASLLTLYSDIKTETELKDIQRINAKLTITDPQLQYPRPVAGYLAIYYLRDQTYLNTYMDITLAVILSILGLLLSAICAINLNRIIIDPIDKITAVIYEIREGNVNVTVNGHMTGELERLRNYINSMATTMSELHNEMQFNVDTATDDLRKTLDRLEEQNKQLELANAKAEDNAKIKSEFLANMSHELRTPLNGIIGFAKQLFKTGLQKEQSEYLNTIERSAKNLLSIVNNILDFSKLESNKLIFEKIPFSLRKLCYECVNLLSPQAHSRGIELSINIDPTLHDLIIGDPVRLEQILNNILGNALKFTQKGSVALRIEPDKSRSAPIKEIRIKFTIQDTGIGISAEQQAQLFQPFTQADSTISRKYGGTGLGLVITKHIIEQMQGELTLTSVMGQGTTFTFSIQVEKSVAPFTPTLAKVQMLNHRRIAVVEKNTWVRESMCSMLATWHLQLYPLSSLQTVHTLINGTGIDYLLIGLEKDYDYNRLLYEFSNLHTDKVQRVIFAQNSLDHDQQLSQLATNVAIISKPVFPDKLLSALVDDIPPQPTVIVSEPLPSPTRALPKVDNLLKVSVLAVDDNDANLLLMKALLSDVVTDVSVANSGQEAIELCLHTEFDLIFMDIQMPILDGIATMHTIKQNANNSHTPVVAVTALVVPQEQQRFIKEGMVDVLYKPIDDNQLKNIINKYCTDNHVALPDMTKTPKDEADNPNVLWTLQRALKQTGGRRELAIEMLEMFLKTVPDMRKTLEQREKSTPAKLAPIVHKFAGGAVYCGLTSVKKLCNVIEQGLKTEGSSIDDYEPEFLELEDSLNNIEQHATSWLAQLKDSKS